MNFSEKTHEAVRLIAQRDHFDDSGQPAVRYFCGTCKCLVLRLPEIDTLVKPLAAQDCLREAVDRHMQESPRCVVFQIKKDRTEECR